MAYELPPALVRMAGAGRLIPFAGAGLSASVGLPTWRRMLQAAADIVEDGPSFDELERSCAGNLLQVAEYLFIASGGHIGPLRQKLAENLITSGIEVARSGCHVELLNLGAPQIYTTNYDDLIERTYKALSLSYDVVALPRHLALGGASTRPQIVKYHGDLRYEQTLVLTESSYYDRMDFESPMDLKFRSDLLGKSVLFVGYSFSDINIRIIWHKLMHMMKDVPERDRPTSWIVRFDADPVQEALNMAAGIRTIVLHPLSEHADGGTPSQRLESFLVDLTLAVSNNGFAPTTSRKQFVSTALLNSIDQAFDHKRVRLGRYPMPASSLARVRALAQRSIPEALRDPLNSSFTFLAGGVISPVADQSDLILKAAINAIKQGFLSTGVASLVIRSQTRTGSRAALFSNVDQYEAETGEFFPWREIYAETQPAGFVPYIIRALRSEVYTHETSPADIDLLYIYDMALRVQDGLISVAAFDEEGRSELQSIIVRVKKVHDGLLADYKPDANMPPPKTLADELQARLPEAPDFDWVANGADASD